LKNIAASAQENSAGTGRISPPMRKENISYNGRNLSANIHDFRPTLQKRFG